MTKAWPAKTWSRSSCVPATRIPRCPGPSRETVLALVVIAGASHVFVNQIETLGVAMGASPHLAALLLAPVATELPEIMNALIWVRQGKERLALANISGAMMIQATIPSALGIFMTPWLLDAPCSPPACSPCCPSACSGCASGLQASPCRCCRRLAGSTPCSPSTWAGTSTPEDGAARCRRTVAAAPSRRGSHAMIGPGRAAVECARVPLLCLYATKVLSISGNRVKFCPLSIPGAVFVNTDSGESRSCIDTAV